MAQNQQFQKQIIRFANAGVKLNLPPELIPVGGYARLTSAISTIEGTLNTTPGATNRLTNFNATNMRRLTDWTVSSSSPPSIFVLSASTKLYWTNATSYPIAVPTQIVTGLDGNPVTLLADTSSQNVRAKAWMFVGNANKVTGSDATNTGMVKVDVSGVVEKYGITKPVVMTFADSGNPGNLNGSYDWRATYYNPTTGHESNPSDIVAQISLVNHSATIGVTVSPDTQVTEIFIYRRGGTLNDTWRRIPGGNADGSFPNATNAAIPDNNSDTAIASARTLELDHDVPITTVDNTGSTLYEVPLPYIWGGEQFSTHFGCGDPNRPDAVYWSKKGDPESWPAANYVSLGRPEEKLLNGFIYDGRSFVFSKENLYQLVPDLVNGTTYTPLKTPVTKGLVGPFSFCVGPMIYFCSKDGIYESDGSSVNKISDDLRSMFPYGSLAGYVSNSAYFPSNFGGINDEATAIKIRMAYHNGEVRFYSNPLGAKAQEVVYDTTNKSWRFEPVDQTVSALWGYSDEITPVVLLRSLYNGDLVTTSGATTDNQMDGANITSEVLTGGHDQGFPRVDKLYGDVAIWVNPSDAGGANSFHWSIMIDSITNTVSTGTITGNGLARYVLPIPADTYGRVIFIDLQWTNTLAIHPGIYWAEVAYIPQVDDITKRQSDWDDLGHPMDKLVKGVIIEADTKGNTITLQAQHDGGTVGTTFTIGPNTAGTPRIYEVGWSAFRGRELRLVPTSTSEWKEYRIVSWIFEPESTALTHYESAAGNGGFFGYHFDREAYIELDSTSVVTVTQTIDNVAQPAYTIPSTAGVRKRVNLPFVANKGKMYKYSLDAPSAFRLHDFERRSRGWNTRIFFDLYYRAIRPEFGTPLVGSSK